MSVCIWRGRLFVGTCSAKSYYCRGVSGDVGIESGHVRRCRLSFGNVGLVSVLFRRCRIIVGTCSSRSDLCRAVFGDVGLVSGRVRRGFLSIETRSARSGLCRDVSVMSA